MNVVVDVCLGVGCGSVGLAMGMSVRVMFPCVGVGVWMGGGVERGRDEGVGVGESWDEKRTARYC